MANLSVILRLTGLLAIIVAQIWLILVIMKGRPTAALLCIVIPFLVLFFIRDEWEHAKRPVLTWMAGLVAIIIGFLIDPIVRRDW